MEQSHSLKTPGTHSLGPWPAVPPPGVEEEPYSRAGRGAWGERLSQEAAPEGRTGGSLGWGSASGRQGLRLPEVSAGQSRRRGWGRGEARGRQQDQAGLNTSRFGFPSCTLHLSTHPAQQGGWASPRGPLPSTPSLRSSAILQVAVTGSLPFTLRAYSIFQSLPSCCRLEYPLLPSSLALFYSLHFLPRGDHL